MSFSKSLTVQYDEIRKKDVEDKIFTPYSFISLATCTISILS